MLAKVAAVVDSEMLVVTNLEYASTATVAFQRGSVVVSELVLVFATLATTHCKDTQCGGTKAPRGNIWVFAMVVFNAGLLMVDHMHFQYNGVLLGLVVCPPLAVSPT